MNINIEAVKKIVEESEPSEWFCFSNNYTLTCYKFRVSSVVTIELDRWQNAGFNCETGKFSGITYDLNVCSTTIERDSSFAEIHFNRIHEFYEEIKSTENARREALAEKIINESLENYKKQPVQNESRGSGNAFIDFCNNMSAKLSGYPNNI